MFGLGLPEILLISLVVVLLFSGKKISELLKVPSTVVKSFKDGINTGRRTLQAVASWKFCTIPVARVRPATTETSAAIYGATACTGRTAQGEKSVDTPLRHNFLFDCHKRNLVILAILTILPITMMAEPIKIKTVQSYVETPTLGKSYNEEMTVVFEVDTIQKTLIVKNVVGTKEYKMSQFYPTINCEKVTIIKFDVSEGNAMDKKYVINIPKPLDGKKITVKETMLTSTREFPPTVYSTHTFASDSSRSGFRTKYLSKHFHDINQTTPTMDHKCTISYSDTVVAIGDLDGTDEMHLLMVTEINDTKGKKSYRCETKGEQYLFELINRGSKDSTPIFKLTRLVDNTPVITTEYFGDILE